MKNESPLDLNCGKIALFLFRYPVGYFASKLVVFLGFDYTSGDKGKGKQLYC
jgi:hypothetical protein